VIHPAASVEEACALSGRLGDDGSYYAGGTELLLSMKLGALRYGHLIDVKPVPELSKIQGSPDGSFLDIGAAVTHRTVEESSLVRSLAPAFARVTSRVGNVRVRATGTVGGNLAFAEPRSDLAAIGLCLDARCEVASGDARRWVDLGAFLLGPYETSLEPGELLTRIRLRAQGGRVLLYDKFQVHERPTVAVGLGLDLDAGVVRDARVVVGAAVPTATRCPDAERRLLGDLPVAQAAAEDVADAAVAGLDVIEDEDGSAEYKQHLVRVLLRRLLAAVPQAEPLGAS
jgi:carbon-monoxide dehydrogenase medium subunit